MIKNKFLPGWSKRFCAWLETQSIEDQIEMILRPNLDIYNRFKNQLI